MGRRTLLIEASAPRQRPRRAAGRGPPPADENTTTPATPRQEGRIDTSWRTARIRTLRETQQKRISDLFPKSVPNPPATRICNMSCGCIQGLPIRPTDGLIDDSGFQAWLQGAREASLAGAAHAGAGSKGRIPFRRRSEAVRCLSISGSEHRPRPGLITVIDAAGIGNRLVDGVVASTGRRATTRS